MREQGTSHTKTKIRSVCVDGKRFMDTLLSDTAPNLGLTDIYLFDISLFTALVGIVTLHPLELSRVEGVLYLLYSAHAPCKKK
jgi:hypothetical protein